MGTEEPEDGFRGGAEGLAAALVALMVLWCTLSGVPAAAIAMTGSRSHDFALFHAGEIPLVDVGTVAEHVR